MQCEVLSCRFTIRLQRSPRNDRIARTTTIAPMSQMMLFMRILSRNGIDLMPTVKVRVRSLASHTRLIGAAGAQIGSCDLTRCSNLPSAHARTGFMRKSPGCIDLNPVLLCAGSLIAGP
jgi:hypothetical protein